MKLSALAVAVFATTALVGGTAAAQAMAPAVTMQPIPNPPEKGGKMMHGKMGKHAHHKMKEKAKSDADTGAMAAPKDDSTAPAATSDDASAKAMKHHATHHRAMKKKSATPSDTAAPAPAPATPQ